MRRIDIKKIFGLIIICLTIFMLSACGKKQYIVGVLYQPNISEAELNAKLGKIDRINPADTKYMYFNDYKSLEQALNTKKINFARIDENVAEYMIGNNATLDSITAPNTPESQYGICFDEENIVVVNEINEAIRAMKKDGTLDRLVEEYIDDVTDAGDPEVEDFPVLDTDINMTIGITGDIPPVDWKDETGHGIGFNQAFLIELSKRLNINVKTVVIPTKDRFTAIKTDKCDGVFYVKTDKSPDAVVKYKDIPSEFLSTESYYVGKDVMVYNLENKKSLEAIAKAQGRNLE